MFTHTHTQDNIIYKEDLQAQKPVKLEVGGGNWNRVTELPHLPTSGLLPQ